MFRKMFQLLSKGCSHSNTSIPFRANTKSVDITNHTDWEPMPPVSTTHYVVCLDCGSKLGYDWQNMKVVKQARRAASGA